MITYPKVLIISPDSILTSNGTGLTLASLFAGWPPDRLANLFYSGEAPPTSVCSHWWPFNPPGLIARATAKAARVTLRNVGDGVVAGLNAGGGQGLWRTRWGTTFQAIADLVTPKLDRATLNKIERFKPDLVYSLLWNLYGMRATEQAAQRTGAPVVPHFMDDWPSTTFQQTIFRSTWRALLLNRLHGILKYAHLGFAICDDMADEFKHRYDLPFAAFMRCVDIPSESSQDFSKPQSPLRLIYTGGLHLGRDNVLTMVASAINELSTAESKSILTVHSPREHEQIKISRMEGSSKFIHFGGVLPSEEVDKALLNADVAVHVESFDPRAVAYTRLSISTKFPSYLAAGLPVLAVGPPEIASIRYVAQHGIGLTVTKPDPDEIRLCIKRLQDKGQWRIFAERAQCVFREQHYAPDVQRRFASILEKAAESRTFK